MVLVTESGEAPVPVREHTHHCPVCERIWTCGETGWHEIDYRWYVSCDACRARGLKPPPDPPVNP